MSSATWTRTSTVARPAAEVWARVTSPAGIRHEMRPWLSMTMPPRLRGRTIDDAAGLLGRPLGKAWVLAGGVLPVDFDDMTLVALEPGRRFHERSRMLLFPHWEHERTVEPVDETTCTVTDRLVLRPRLPGTRHVVGLLFAHRHRRLVRWGEGSGAAR
ncbi:hypothetical protein GGQ22_10570 [Nocardioides sp. zg-579]|uniref:SRPBCC family protein n=1 Tax=Nocardioides marmotae TaxID=2663857 RepID=A0A6I3JBN2_9ACTN|nr:hypothetical protein [Nocardioides marmotae]MCR6031888.1 hypothetical protein [Gordonia jinghuaiqii]MTB95528.1 hypothetical protein [Nocardioides marmotae]QKE00953.1 hypothetical protein HPC71_07630 [Nocardioides marmotae]